MSASPGSVTFGDVEVGTNSTQTVTLSNSGNASLTVSQAGVSGSGFATSGLSFPLTLPGGQFASLSVQFAPTVTGSVSGSVSVVSNASNSPTTIALRGNGVRHQLSITPSSVSFGNVVVGTTNTQTIALTNSGTANLTVSQASVSGNGFTTSGLTLPLTLSPGQSANFNVAFAPASIGSVTGSVTVVSNATNSPTTIALSGTGVQAISHSVNLMWDASTSVVAGYYIYRGTLSGGPYTKLNATPVSLTTYIDNAVQSGLTYFYVATAVDSNNVESVLSNEISATIP